MATIPYGFSLRFRVIRPLTVNPGNAQQAEYDGWVLWRIHAAALRPQRRGDCNHQQKRQSDIRFRSMGSSIIYIAGR